MKNLKYLRNRYYQSITAVAVFVTFILMATAALASSFIRPDPVASWQILGCIVGMFVFAAGAVVSVFETDERRKSFMRYKNSVLPGNG